VLKNLLGYLWARAWRAPRPVARTPLEFRRAFDAMLEADDYDAARSLAEQALARGEWPYESQLLLGRALQKLHEPERALACFEAARRLRGGDAELYDFRGALYQELGRLPEAFADFEQALALQPDFPLARFHRAMARLLAGDFERGWDDYELRRLGAEHAQALAGLPRWDGGALAGRTLFVAREQGLGDEIMFASILPQLLAQGGRCVLECDPRLVPLLRRSFPAATVFGTEPGGGLPASIPRASIDVAIEAGSLPGLFRRRAGDFPRHEGYLRADPDAVARWRSSETKRSSGIGCPSRKP